MELEGSLSENLGGAIASARRHRGHRVHADTVAYWKSLLAHARELGRLGQWSNPAEIAALVADLQNELIVFE